MNKLGTSSVSYEIAIFKESDPEKVVAVGGYTHVFVDRDSRKSMKMDESLSEGLSKIALKMDGLAKL